MMTVTLVTGPPATTMLPFDEDEDHGEHDAEPDADDVDGGDDGNDGHDSPCP